MRQNGEAYDLPEMWCQTSAGKPRFVQFAEQRYAPLKSRYKTIMKSSQIEGYDSDSDDDYEENLNDDYDYDEEDDSYGNDDYDNDDYEPARPKTNRILVVIIVTVIALIAAMIVLIVLLFSSGKKSNKQIRIQ